MVELKQSEIAISRLRFVRQAPLPGRHCRPRNLTPRQRRHHDESTHRAKGNRGQAA